MNQAGAAQVGNWLREEERPDESLFVTNVSGIHAPWISEFVMGFISMHALQMPTFLKQQWEGKTWQKQPTLSIAGSTVLVLGLGAIGESVARLCEAYGCTVLATRRSAAPGEAPPPHCAELHPPSALHELLPRADYVVISTPGSAETAELIGAKELELMKSSSVLVNVSRKPRLCPRVICAAFPKDLVSQTFQRNLVDRRQHGRLGCADRGARRREHRGLLQRRGAAGAPSRRPPAVVRAAAVPHAAQLRQPGRSGARRWHAPLRRGGERAVLRAAAAVLGG